MHATVASRHVTINLFATYTTSDCLCMSPLLSIIGWHLVGGLAFSGGPRKSTRASAEAIRTRVPALGRHLAGQIVRTMWTSSEVAWDGAGTSMPRPGLTMLR